MSRSRLGAVTIGQAPRPDLLEPLLERAGADVDVIEVGALDGLMAEQLPGKGRREKRAYPLTTRLRDGSRVTLDECDLAPLVQQAIDRAEDAGAEATLLLCAGGFGDATARRSLVRPFDAAMMRLRQGGAGRLAIVVPYEDQAGPSLRKWAAEGFEATVLVGDPATLEVPEAVTSVDAIVLDYVGHPAPAVEALRGRASVPVVDLGECGADAIVALLAGRRGPAAVAIR